MVYCFACPDCGCRYEVVAPIKEGPVESLCACGGVAHRDRRAELASGAVDCMNRDYSFDGESGTRLYGASYLPNQRDEAHRAHPDTEFKVYNGTLLPVIKNRRHKLRYLKEHGYVEY